APFGLRGSGHVEMSKLLDLEHVGAQPESIISACARNGWQRLGGRMDFGRPCGNRTSTDSVNSSTPGQRLSAKAFLDHVAPPRQQVVKRWPLWADAAMCLPCVLPEGLQDSGARRPMSAS